MSTTQSSKESHGDFAPGYQQRQQGPTARFNPEGLHHPSKMASLDSFDPENMDFSLMQEL